MSAASDPVAISVRAVEKTYRGPFQRPKKALAGVDLEVRRGEVFGLIGPNGAGKTTLLTCLLGLLRPDVGTIHVNGRSPEDLSVRERTGYLPERLGFDRDLTGRYFLTFHARLAGLPAASRARAVEEGAAAVELSPEALGRRLRTYSRGMLQRIGLAQALLGTPELLFLDEPTSGMDPVGVALVRERILATRARGGTVLLNSHQLSEVERVCDRVAFVSGGRVERVEVLRAADALRGTWGLRVGAGEDERACLALKNGGFEAAAVGDGRLRVGGPLDHLARIAPLLVNEQISVLELGEATAKLEELFVKQAGARPGADGA